MFNLKDAQGYKVVGKVVDGVMTMTATKPNHKGFIIRKAVKYTGTVVVPQEANDMRINQTTGQTYITPKKEPAIKKVEPVIEVPAFMKERSKKMQEERAAKAKQKKRKGSIFDLRV